MLKKQISGLTAQKLRVLMIVSMLVLIILASAGFLFIRNQLTTYAEQVRSSTAKANSSTENLATLEVLKSQLAEDADTVQRTKSIVADSQSYAYQDQIIKDINTYAQRSNVGVSGYTFNTAAGASAAATTPTATGKAATPAVSGLKSVSVAVNLKSPVKYSNIMNFIHSIEQNLTKMQLAGVSLSKDPTSGDITVSTLTLEVYTR
jgi:hypothetical protein